MEKSSFSPDGLLAKMVEKMPNVAIDVLNKCLNKCESKKEENDEENDGENDLIEYDFFALQTRGGIILKHLYFLIKILGNASYRQLQFKDKQNINLT